MIGERFTKERSMRSERPLSALLIVDDTMSTRELLIHTLRSLVPYEIIAVTDATVALAVLAVRPIPLLMSDYHLSDMRGDELAAATKAASPATSVLMIAADVELDAEAGWTNVDHCLIKPFPMRDLVAVVSTLLPSTVVVRC
jgi:two-component system, response regulator, stage 0 sporulation protein F